MNQSLLPAAFRRSLRIRLLAGTLSWILLSIVLAGWGLDNLFRQHIATQFHGELTTHLDQLTAQLTMDEQGRPRLALPLSDPRFSRPYAGHYWQIDRLDGQPERDSPAIGQLRSRSLWDFVLNVPDDSLSDGATHRHRIVGPEGKMLGMIERSVRIDETPDARTRSFRLIVAADESLMLEPAARFGKILWLALGILAAGVVVAALVQVFVGLAPLRQLHGALGRVRNGEAPALEGDFPVEIMPLIEEFNSVLSQNAEVVDRARTQAGNLAHALKTPLSVLANAADSHARDNGELARLVGEQVSLARTQVDYHLARAQAAATSRLPGARTAVQPAIEGLLRTMRRIHADRGLQLNLRPIPETLSFRGEAQDLQEMLGNLLDNACKWARQTVECSVRHEAGCLVIDIDDDGAGLPAEQREAVIRRGIRADELVPGSGLGLAIVDDLARLYGGQLELSDSPLGGLRARLTLPAAA